MSTSNTGSSLQTKLSETLADGTTSTVTTSGAIVHSQDPTTNPNASMGEKLKGDVQGAISGSIGSMQAVIGSMTGNKEMKQNGLDKMSAEDQRLGAKHGVMPVGSGLRETKTDAK
jgi:hypothetical protein